MIPPNPASSTSSVLNHPFSNKFSKTRMTQFDIQEQNSACVTYLQGFPRTCNEYLVEDNCGHPYGEFIMQWRSSGVYPAVGDIYNHNQRPSFVQEPPCFRAQHNSSGLPKQDVYALRRSVNWKSYATCLGSMSTRTLLYLVHSTAPWSSVFWRASGGLFCQ